MKNIFLKVLFENLFEFIMLWNFISSEFEEMMIIMMILITLVAFHHNSCS